MTRIDLPVRVGVVGFGRFGRLHALTLAGLAEAELVGVVARRSESLHQLNVELPQVQGWVNLDQALRESDAEAWVVACSTSKHVRVAETLLAAGKIVLLEKPISETLEDALRLEPLVKSESANLMLGHIVLFNTEFQQLQQEVSRRGPLAFIDCVRHRPASIVKDFPGENPLFATMVHDLYCVQALMNGSEPTHYQARFHRTANGAVNVANAQLQWDNSTLVTLTASYLTPLGMPSRGFDRMEVFGDGWAARIEPNPRPVEVWGEAASWPLTLEIRSGTFGPTGMMAEELRTFCRVVRGLSPVPIGARFIDGIQVQRWMTSLSGCAESLP
jgi:predicted dehydrogenase